MKLQLSQSLRTALLSCYTAANFTLSLPITTMTVALVSFSLFSEQTEAAITVTPTGAGNGGIGPNTGTITDHVLTDFTYGWFGGGNFGWTAPSIYIQNWRQNDGSNSEKVVVNGDLKDANLLSSEYTGGDIEIAAASIAFEHDHVFNGAHHAFSGDFIMSVNSLTGVGTTNLDPGTDNHGGKDFVFTNRDIASAEAIERTNISGTGAIEFGIRTAGDGLAVNNKARDAIYFYSGAVSIGNSVINADTLSLNGLNTGANTSTGYKASRISNMGTDGATYTITSQLNLATLEINDGSTAILTGTDTPVQSTVGVVSFAGTSSLQVANLSHLTLTGTQTVGADQLSVLDGGQLTINGRLNLTSSITFSGILDFGTTGILDLSGLTGTAIGDGYEYNINTLTEGDTGEILGLSYDRILGVNGMNSSASITYSGGKLTVSGILPALEFTGSDSSSSPTPLDWNVAGAFNDGETFTEGRGVIFDAHTTATLSADTRVGDLVVRANSSLSINSASQTLKINDITLNTNSQFRLDYLGLDLSMGAIRATGVTGSTLSLDGHDGASYNLTDVFNLSDYSGEVNINNATVTLASISDLGAASTLTLSEAAVLESAGLTFSAQKAINVGGNAVLTSTSGTTTLNTLTGASDTSLTLNGNIKLNSSVAFQGAIIINSGTTTFGAGQGTTDTLSVKSITVKQNAQFTIQHQGRDFTATAFNMEGGTLFSGDIDKSSNGIQFGTLTLSGTNTIKHEYDGSFTFTNLTGSGTLTFDADASGVEDGKLKFFNTTNYHGAINFGTGDSEDELIFTGTISQNAESHMSIGGRFRADVESATFTGAGSTSFNAGARFSGTSTIQSGTVNVSAIDFEANSTLSTLGGRLNLNAASFAADADGTLKLGAATVGSSEASVNYADHIELGAYASSGTAGTSTTPIATTVDTTQTDSAEGITLHITGNITDTSGSAGSLQVTGAGSLTLSGDNSFSGGLNISESTVILGSTTAAGTGNVTVAGGTLNAGAQAIQNTVNYSSGSLSGMSSFAGTLNVNGNLSLNDGISGAVTIASDMTLDLSGTWKYTSAISNEGTLTFGADMILDIAGLDFEEAGDGSYTLQLVSGTGAVDTSSWLTGETVDKSKLIGTLAGRTFTYSDGVLRYTIDNKNLTWYGGDLDLAVNKLFSEGGSFANDDNMIFQADSTTTLTVMENLTSGIVTLQSGAEVNSADSAFNLHIDNLDIRDGASFDMGTNVTAGIITMQDASSITTDSLTPIISATLSGTAHLIIEEEIAAGAVSIDNIIGGADSALTISLASGDSTVDIANFTGHLTVASGSMQAALADKTDFATVTLGANASYEITDTLGNVDNIGTYDLTYLKGASGSTLTLSGTGLSTGGGARSSISLSSEFAGSVELLTGSLSGKDSIFGGASSITLHDNTGLVGDSAAYGTATLNLGVNLASGATAFARVWGTGRVLSLNGALSGLSNTTLKQTDIGTLKLSGDMTNFAGSLSVDGFKIIVDTDATNLNKILITGNQTLEVTSGHTVTASGTDEGSSFYQRRIDNTANIENFTQNIIVGANSTLTDNVYIRLGEGTVNVSGGGTYTIVGFMGSDAAADHDSNLTIAASTTLIVSGTTQSSSASALPSFLLGHYTNGGDTAVSVSGKLVLNSGISSFHGSGTITVNDGGTLTLNKGLYGVDEGNSAGAINIVAAANSTLELGNQATESVAGVVTVDVAAGATIKAISAETNIHNKIDLSGNGTVTLTGNNIATTVVVNGVLAQKAGSTTGLKFSSTTGQSFMLNGANTYTGGTIIDGATVVAGNASAFGTDGAITVTSGSLHLNGQAVNNNITVNGGSVSGLSSYTGTVTFNATNTINDAITGGIVISASGNLTLNGEWDFTSAIENQGTLNFGNDFTLDLEGATFAQSEGKYILELFTGTGSTNFGTQFSTSNLTGITTEGYEFSYENGVLSYREVQPLEGDIIVANASEKSIVGGNVQNIILETASSKVYLGENFTQRTSATISGQGEVHIASGESATLGNVNSYSGGTMLGETSTLIVDIEGALGSGDVNAAANSNIEISEGVSMGNNVNLDAGAKLKAGVLTVTGRADGTSSVGGTDSVVSHDASGVGSIYKASVTDVDVLLAADGTGHINDTILTNANVTLGNGSVMTMRNSIQGIGTTISNNTATLNLIDHTMQVSSADGGGLTIGEKDITTLKGETHSMTVYTANTVAVENVEVTGTFTLDIVLNSVEFEAFGNKFDLGEFLAFEIVGFGLDDVEGIWYHDVIINIHDTNLDQNTVTINPLGVTYAGTNLVYFIPEPSTATLSLLALAGLLARRRRKQD